MPTAKVSIEEHEKNLLRSQLQVNDVLFSIVGTLGRVGIVKKGILPANTNQQIAIIRVIKDVSPLFLVQLLQSDSIRRFIRSDATIGAQPSISLWQLNDLKISTPKYKEQVKISLFFSNVSNLIAHHQRESFFRKIAIINMYLEITYR